MQHKVYEGQFSHMGLRGKDSSSMYFEQNLFAKLVWKCTKM